MVPRLCSWLGMTSLQLRQIGHVKKGFSEQRKSPWANGGTPSLAALLAKGTPSSLLCWPSKKTYCQLPCRYFPEKSRKVPLSLVGVTFFDFCLVEGMQSLPCMFEESSYYSCSLRLCCWCLLSQILLWKSTKITHCEITIWLFQPWDFLDAKNRLDEETFVCWKNWQLDVSERLMFYWWPGTYNQRT